jgi:hypothetical protein
MPLLAAYARAVVQEELAAEHLRAEGHVVNGKASAWLIVQEKATRAMVSLSLRLRLSPQARTPQYTKAPSRPLSYYERMQSGDLENGDDIGG